MKQCKRINKSINYIKNISAYNGMQIINYIKQHKAIIDLVMRHTKNQSFIIKVNQRNKK